MDATGALAAHTIGLDAERLPGAVVDQARTVLADTVGVLLSASGRNAVGTAVRASQPLAGPCTVVGHGSASPEVAAFINGIGGHDIELDDSHSPSRTHPAAVVIPAALAGAEIGSDVTFGDMLAAIVAGYDAQSRVSKAIGRSTQYDRGFHPSAVCGAIGAAVAAGRMLRLGLDQMRSAIGLAASQSSGLLTYADDPYHMAKSFQTGVAARNGVTAALFARAGYHAAPDVLTGRNNMLRPFGGDATDPSRLTAELGVAYDICETSLKRHACCGLAHAAVDAMLLLLDAAQLEAGAIEAIEVQLPTAAVPRVDGNRLWSHNIQYVLALTAHERHVDLAHFTPEWTSKPEITRLAATVTVRGSDDLQARFPEQKGAIVTVTSRGETITRRVDAPRGSPLEPLSRDELDEKFQRLASPAIGADGAARLSARLAGTGLDELPGPIFAALRPGD